MVWTSNVFEVIHALLSGYSTRWNLENVNVYLLLLNSEEKINISRVLEVAQVMYSFDIS